MSEVLSYIVFARVGDGWSISNRGQWWCGDDDEWVSPRSSYWAFDPRCRNRVFDSLGEAIEYAIRRGWVEDEFEDDAIEEEE